MEIYRQHAIILLSAQNTQKYEGRNPVAKKKKTTDRRLRVRDDNDLLTATEAAKELRVSSKTLQGWVKDKKITHIRLGPKAVRFEPADIAEHKRKMRVESNTP